MISAILEGEERNLFIPESGALRDSLLAADVLVGVTDERTDEAVGVLAADAVLKKRLAIHHIFVAPSKRRRGAGRALMAELIDYAGQLGAEEIVCSHFVPKDGDAVTGFLDRMGFITDPELTTSVYEAPLSAMNVDADALPGKTSQLKKELPLEYDSDLSFIFTDQSGKEAGQIVVSSGKDTLTVEHLAVRGALSDKVLLVLLGHFLDAASKKYSEDTRVSFLLSSNSVAAVIKVISGGRLQKTGENVFQMLERIDGSFPVVELPFRYYGMAQYISDNFPANDGYDEENGGYDEEAERL